MPCPSSDGSIGLKPVLFVEPISITLFWGIYDSFAESTVQSRAITDFLQVALCFRAKKTVFKYPSYFNSS